MNTKGRGECRRIWSRHGSRHLLSIEIGGEYYGW